MTKDGDSTGSSRVPSTSRKAFFALISIVVLQACSESPTALEPGTSDLEGVVTARGVADHGLRVLVEEDPSVQEPLEPDGGKIWFTITWDTRVYRRASPGTLARATAELIVVGSRVEAWVGGNAIADSYPQQALAATIIVHQ